MSDLWWEKQLEMANDFEQIRYMAAAFFPDKDFDNFGCIAEQIFYETQDE